MDFEKLSKEIEDTLVSLIAQSNTIHTQLDTIENPPCELTADNHIIITVSNFVLKSFNFNYLVIAYRALKIYQFV